MQKILQGPAGSALDLVAQYGGPLFAGSTASPPGDETVAPLVDLPLLERAAAEGHTRTVAAALPAHTPSKFFDIDESAAPGEQNWPDTGSYPTSEPVGYVEIPHVWPGDHIDPADEPDLMPDLSSSIGTGEEGVGSRAKSAP